MYLSFVMYYTYIHRRYHIFANWFCENEHEKRQKKPCLSGMPIYALREICVLKPLENLDQLKFIIISNEVGAGLIKICSLAE